MPKLTLPEWQDIRAEREAGQSFRDLAKRFGVSGAAICKRAKAEGWGDGTDVGEEVRRKVDEKINAVSTSDPQKKSAAIDAAAEKSAEVIRRHREETNVIRERLYSGLKTHKAATTRGEKQLAFEDLKAAKISSECLLNIHKAERQAWGIDDGNVATGKITIRWAGGDYQH
jgi:hypothetical protein